MTTEEVVSGPSHRSLRVMAVVRWVLLGLVTALAITTVWTYWGPSGDEHADHGGDRYYCPMHPEVRSHDPGQCPICHMDLVPIPEARQESEAVRAAPSGGPSPDHVSPVTLSEDKQRAAGLSTTLVESSSVGDRLRVPGVLSAPETGRAEVRVRAPGFVEQVAVRESGVRVSAGQPLAFVYSPDIYRAQEEFLAVSRWNAPKDGTPSAGGTDLGAASRRSLELLGLSSADIDQVLRTGQPIRATAVRAPAGGVVTRAGAILGSRAEPETVLYEIADLSKLWIVASVQERDLGAMRVGTEARFSISGSAAEPLLVKVDLIEPLLEEATRSARVRFVVKNPDGQLRPGQFGDVEFDLPRAPGLFVPRDAVIRTGEHDYVYVLVGSDRFEPRSVTTGLLRDGRIQVTTGLTAGERVVTRGSFMLDSESRLQTSLTGTQAGAHDHLAH